MGKSDPQAKIKAAFAAYFEGFDINLPDVVPVSGLDRERAERERKAADDPLIADLKRRGLW